MRSVKVPLLPELAVKKIWAEAVKISGFIAYCSKEWDGSRVCRPFFWNTLMTLNFQYVCHLIENCRSIRSAARQEQMQGPPAQFAVSDNMLMQLMSVTFDSSRCPYLCFSHIVFSRSQKGPWFPDGSARPSTGKAALCSPRGHSHRQSGGFPAGPECTRPKEPSSAQRSQTTEHPSGSG